MSEIKVDKISPQSGVALEVGDSGDTITCSGTAVGFGGGKVLQCIAVHKSDVQTISGNTFTTVLSKTITPAATSSSVLVQVQINVTASVRYAGVKLYRDGIQLSMGDAAGSRTRVSVESGSNDSNSNDGDVMHDSSITFLDTAISTISAVTYTVKCANTYSGGSYGTGSTTYINRVPTDTDADYTQRGASSLILTEIGA